MTQDHDLELQLTAATGEHANDATQQPVQQTRQYDGHSEPGRPRSPAPPFRPESNFFTPHPSSIRKSAKTSCRRNDAAART